jgi:tRNA dimethylallyltransferase
MHEKRRIGVVFGPTGSGKSAAALALAEGGAVRIINADSRQVYGVLPRLAANPTAAEMARAPHALYGYAAPDEQVTAAAWAKRAAVEIADAWAAGQLPLLVGGTGLYLEALRLGLSPMPEVPDAVRDAVQAEMAVNPAGLWREFAAGDPVLAAAVHQAHTSRWGRALAVQRATGQPMSAWQAAPRVPLVQGAWRVACLEPDRTWLEPRLWQRWEAMVGAGVLDEVAAAQRAGFTNQPAVNVLGWGPLQAVLAGSLSLAEAGAQVVRQQLDYAKRQRTWGRTRLKPDMVLPLPEVGMLRKVFALLG